MQRILDRYGVHDWSATQSGICITRSLCGPKSSDVDDSECVSDIFALYDEWTEDPILELVILQSCPHFFSRVNVCPTQKRPPLPLLLPTYVR